MKNEITTMQSQDEILFSGKDIVGTIIIETSNGFKSYRGAVVQRTEWSVTIETDFGFVNGPWCSLRELTYAELEVK